MSKIKLPLVKNDEVIAWIIIILMIIALIILSLGATALIVWGICKCFGFVFTWKLAIGIWLIMILFEACVKPTSTLN